MEHRKFHYMICATVLLYLVLAAAICCSAGRVFPTNDRGTCVGDSCKPLNADTKSALDSSAAIHRLVISAGKSDEDIFVTDYTYHPGSPRPLPQAPRGRAPRIGVPPPITEITPQVSPPLIIITPNPRPAAPESTPLPRYLPSPTLPPHPSPVLHTPQVSFLSPHIG